MGDTPAVDVVEVELTFKVKGKYSTETVKKYVMPLELCRLMEKLLLEAEGKFLEATSK
jgi:hypothetical protein